MSQWGTFSTEEGLILQRFFLQLFANAQESCVGMTLVGNKGFPTSVATITDAGIATGGVGEQGISLSDTTLPFEKRMNLTGRSIC